MKKIIILSRVSTEAQDLTSQTKELISKAIQLGYKDSKQQIVIENVESAIKLSENERIGIQKLKHYIETDKDIDCVICWEPSRLSRQQKVLYSVRDYLVDHKIQLYILNPYMKLLTDDRTQIDTTASIVFSLFSTLAENEMMIKKERFMRAKNELTRQGKKSAGATIFGYMKDKDKNCVPHPVYSKMIVELFRHYTNEQDTSLYETYKYATQQWPETFPILEYKKAQHKIRHFFDTQVYWEGNWCYPPLITKDMHLKCKEKMSQSRCKPRFQCKRDLLCRGRIYCGECGRMMTAASGNTKAYFCPTDKLHSIQVNIDAMEWLVWNETKTLVNLNAAVDNNTKVIEIEERIRAKKNELSELNNIIGNIESKEEKLIDLYMDSKIDKTMLDKRMESVKDEKSMYEQQRASLQSEINEFLAILESSNQKLKTQPVNIDDVTIFENKLEFVRKYIDKVIVTNKKEYALIEFKYRQDIIIPQCGIYRYKNLGGWKHIWRVNEDETLDLILNEKKIKE